MAGVNKVILIGNLGRDPEIRYTQGGQAVCNFTLATTESWAAKDGGPKEEKTEWHRVVAWGRLAEICGEYLAKGRQVYIEGRLQTREWEDRDGNKRVTTEVVAQTMQMLGRPPQGGENARPHEGRGESPKSQGKDSFSSGKDGFGGDYGGPAGDDDIPF